MKSECGRPEPEIVDIEFCPKCKFVKKWCICKVVNNEEQADSKRNNNNKE